MERAAPKQRVNQTPIARFERWALPRMAHRLPGWMTPDTLTVIGLVGAGLIGAGYLLTAYGLGWLWLSSFGFVLHWWGDSLDGTLARVRDIRRERYGFYVDHQSDAVSSVVIFLCLGLSPLMPLATALFLLVGYLLLMILVNLVTIARDVFKISFGGVGPTEARVLMIAGNTLVFFLGNPTLEVLGFEGTLFGLLGAVGAVGLTAYYVVFGLIERSKLAKLDPPPSPAAATNGTAATEVALPEETVPEKAPVGSR